MPFQNETNGLSDAMNKVRSLLIATCTLINSHSSILVQRKWQSWLEDWICAPARPTPSCIGLGYCSGFNRGREIKWCVCVCMEYIAESTAASTSCLSAVFVGYSEHRLHAGLQTKARTKERLGCLTPIWRLSFERDPCSAKGKHLLSSSIVLTLSSSVGLISGLGLGGSRLMTLSGRI